MNQNFNANILKALQLERDAIAICRQAMIDANDDSCRAIYSGIMSDCEKHIKMLENEILLHKKLDKWTEP